MPTEQQYPTSLEQSARTAVAAAAALLIARLLHQQEAYWAPITTLIVLQSTLRATISVSVQRIIGTALGAAIGALTATYFHGRLVPFAIAIFLLGLICTLLHLPRSAYRYAGVALAIVTLIARAEGPWTIAVHRFEEVSLGIVVGLALTAVWPERTLQKPTDGHPSAAH